MPNAMRILSNHCKSKPTDRDTLSSSVGFLYTGYLTLTPFHYGSPEFLCLFSLFGRNLVANSMLDSLKPA